MHFIRGIVTDRTHQSPDDSNDSNDMNLADNTGGGRITMPPVGTATRRGILAATALLGGAGVVSAQSGRTVKDDLTARSGEPDTLSQKPLGGTESLAGVAEPTTTAIVQVPGDYKSIQKAINNLPLNGGTILIDEPNYSPANDSLPIRMTDRPANIIGTTHGDQSSDGLDFTGNKRRPVFVLDISTNWRINVRFENLHILGGRDIISLRSGQFFVCNNCWFEDAARHGIHHKSSGEALYMSVNNTVIENCGRDGISLSNASGGARPNAMVLNHVISRGHRRHGAWLRGAGCRTLAGSFEQNGGAGLKIGTNDKQTTATLLGPYFEDNGSRSEGTHDDADVHAQPGGDKSVTIIGAYQSGSSPSTEGLYLRTGQGHWIGASTSISRGTNVRIGSRTRDAQVWTTAPMDVTVDSGATRPCVNGLYRDSGGRNTPRPNRYAIGDVVEWTDTDNHSGDGVYRLGFDGSTWYKLGTGT